jgi:pimeloyl-ACP methyl ester carboxylesterase
MTTTDAWQGLEPLEQRMLLSVVAMQGAIEAPPEFFSSTTRLIDFDFDSAGQPISHTTDINEQYASWGVRFSLRGGPDTSRLTTFINTQAKDPISQPNSLFAWHTAWQNVLSPDNSAPTVVVTFDATALGGLPTEVAFVFTDSAPNNPFTAKVFSQNGVVLDTITINTADNSPYPDGHIEDTFIGFRTSQGIAILEFTTEFMLGSGIYGFEIDNLEFAVQEFGVSFPASFPAKYTVGSGAPLTLNFNGTIPTDTKVVMLAWSDSQKRMIDAFAHELNLATGRISNAKLDLLPPGPTEIQALYNGKKITKWINIESAASLPPVLQGDISDGHKVYLHRRDAIKPIAIGIPTWIVIHGRNSSINQKNIKELTDALVANRGEAQVLALDWPAAHAPYFRGEQYIPEVGDWLAKQISTFDPAEVYLVGHSWGSYVAAEAAGKLNGVASLVAIDPARDVQITEGGSLYDPEKSINFKDVSQWSWAFYAAHEIESNIATSSRAHESFVVTKSNHSTIVDLVTHMVRGGGSGDRVSPHFSMRAFLSKAQHQSSHTVMWEMDQFDHNGNHPVLPVFRVYEAVITATSMGTRPESLTYVPKRPYDADLLPDPVTISVAGNTLKTAIPFKIAGSTPATLLNNYVGPMDPVDYHSFKVKVPTRLTFSLADLTDNANLFLYNVQTGATRKIKYKRIAKSTKPGATNEKITKQLPKGRYIIGVKAAGTDTTPYTLSVKAKTSKKRVRVNYGTYSVDRMPVAATTSSDEAASELLRKKKKKKKRKPNANRADVQFGTLSGHRHYAGKFTPSKSHLSIAFRLKKSGYLFAVTGVGSLDPMTATLYRDGKRLARVSTGIFEPRISGYFKAGNYKLVLDYYGGYFSDSTRTVVVSVSALYGPKIPGFPGFPTVS